MGPDPRSLDGGVQRPTRSMPSHRLRRYPRTVRELQASLYLVSPGLNREVGKMRRKDGKNEVPRGSNADSRASALSFPSPSPRFVFLLSSQHDLSELFRIGGNSPDTNYLFMGDYVSSIDQRSSLASRFSFAPSFLFASSWE